MAYSKRTKGCLQKRHRTDLEWARRKCGRSLVLSAKAFPGGDKMFATLDPYVQLDSYKIHTPYFAGVLSGFLTGFSLVGNTSQEDGEWSGSDPTCNGM